MSLDSVTTRTFEEFSSIIQTADGALNIIGILIILLLAFWRYVAANSKENKLNSVKSSFVSVTAQLSSPNETDKISAAILLRRFFDTNTEMGLKGRPFKKEAVNLIAGMLKVEPTGRLQKILAEGLIYAETIINQDLQKVNLHDVHLGKSLGYSPVFRWNKKYWNQSKLSLYSERFPDFSGSDFFRSDLSKASFANCSLVACVFYEADCNNTIFRGSNLAEANFNGANLKMANFSGANLLNAKFDGADLKGARFKGAKHIPQVIEACLNDDRVYVSKPPEENLSVFISRPAVLPIDSPLTMKVLQSYLSEYDVGFTELNRGEYKSYDMLGDISQRIEAENGLVIFGVADFQVDSGHFRRNTSDQKPIEREWVSAPWTQIEAGMAIAHKKPILLIKTSPLSDGIYDSSLEDSLLVQVDLSKHCSSEDLKLGVECFVKLMKEYQEN